MSETVRVRIAVGVCRDGTWHATGSEGYEDDDAIGIILDCLDSPTEPVIAWVEAEIPLPEQETIEGKVTSTEHPQP